jgi:taurine dioxygenase
VTATVHATAAPPPASARSRTRSGPRIASRTPAGWVDAPYTRFELTALTPTIGAEVGGLDLRQPLDDETHAELHRALLEWKVLFFRDQNLTAAQHEALGRRWGDLEWHPFVQATAPEQDAGQPKVLRLAKGDRAKGNENVWHSDVTWRERPSFGSILRAVELPAVGGDTLWADMGAAYDCLDEDIKARIDGLTAVHDWWDTFGRAMTSDERDALRPGFPPVEHPVVRTHPETGRRTLFVNAAFTQHIVGLEPAESVELLDLLYRQASCPEFQCRFKWTPGAIAFWDNRSTQHYATSDYFPQRRVMERITIVGDRPY